MDLYISLLLNSIVGHFFLPPSGAYLAPAMIVFKVGHPQIVLFVSTIGAAIGYSINYMVGLGLIKLLERSPQHNPEPYEKGRQFFNRYLLFLLPFSWYAFLIAFTLGAGAMRTRPVLFLALILIGETVYQLYQYRLWIG